MFRLVGLGSEQEICGVCTKQFSEKSLGRVIIEDYSKHETVESCGRHVPPNVKLGETFPKLLTVLERNTFCK